MSAMRLVVRGGTVSTAIVTRAMGAVDRGTGPIASVYGILWALKQVFFLLPVRCLKLAIISSLRFCDSLRT